MLSARVRDQLRVAGSRLRWGSLDLRGKTRALTPRLKAMTGWLKIGFGLSLGVYLIVKVVNVTVMDLPAMADLVVLPAGACALGLAFARGSTADDAESDAQEDETIRLGLWAAGALALFVIVYLTVSTVPMITSQDESAISLGAHQLATERSLRATSPWNDRYDTNVIGALHVIYRSPTEMYYRTFPGMAVIYAPFSVLPDGLGYRSFTALFGTLAVVALYFVAWKLLRSWQAALVAGLMFAVAPAFGHWAVTIYNNVPALALELSAFAVVLWARPERSWQFALAGLLMSLAFFVRITEVVYLLPLLVLVWWRTKALRPMLAFGSASLAGIPLVALTNQIFYGDALFLPQVGTGYIPLLPGYQPPTSAAVVEQYATYSTGDPGSAWYQALRDTLTNVWYHLRYLASSTFAFPFLALAFLGLVWRVAAGRRGAWLLATVIVTATLAVLAMYGQRDSNYYGFGQPIVRSSFIRYSLLLYALFAIAAGAFFLEARRVLRDVSFAAALPLAALGIILTIGVAQSYDSDVYGLNRLNDYRRDDQRAWNALRPFFDSSQGEPLLIGGPAVEKLIDHDYERSFINYETIPPYLQLPLLASVGERASRERDVYLITSGSNQYDKLVLATMYSLYQPQQVLVAGEFRVHRLRFEPPNYKLTFVDVWNVYAGYDRWTITPEGYLQPVADNAYVQVFGPVDVDGNGRVDRDITIQVEILDAGPADVTVYGLGSQEGWHPVTLAQAVVRQTGAWQTLTLTMKKGEHLQPLLAVSPGVTIRSIAVVALGPP